VRSLCGRTFEAYGEDPHLAGEIAAGTVRGIQSEGTIGEPKHYLANNQESDRNSVNERIDERTLREIYLPAFEAAVKQGGAGAVMCAKNQINGSYACEHDELLQGVLKDEWGFRGFVVSDFRSCHDTIRCAFGGLDFELPSGARYGDPLKAAVKADQVPRAVLDDHVHRVLETMLRFGLFERQPGTRPMDAARGGADSRAAAEAGTVLLKNERGVLSLDTQRDRSIALIGPGSHTAVAISGGSTGVAPLYTVSPLQAITRRVGNRATINAATGWGRSTWARSPRCPRTRCNPRAVDPATALDRPLLRQHDLVRRRSAHPNGPVGRHGPRAAGSPLPGSAPTDGRSAGPRRSRLPPTATTRSTSQISRARSCSSTAAPSSTTAADSPA
jgi:Glycosyl hydrolase family 3 N terminal domain/Glycosyl hydrolase family 3 C-terminal domain